MALETHPRTSPFSSNELQTKILRRPSPMYDYVSFHDDGMVVVLQSGPEYLRNMTTAVLREGLVSFNFSTDDISRPYLLEFDD
jgi:hypothetical protein